MGKCSDNGLWMYHVSGLKVWGLIRFFMGSD